VSRPRRPQPRGEERLVALSHKVPFALALLAGLVAAALTVAAPAGSANECNGLQVCVPVRGPWVVVAGGDGASRPRTEFQLSCPQRHIVAGLDAELSIRELDVGFYGKLGSPVNPGITTRRDVTFFGTNVSRSSRPATFRPYIGCIPSAGGGPRIPTSVSAFPPGDPTARRVRNVRVRPGTATASVRCRSGERLVGAAHAFGFHTRNAPGASLISTVSGTRTVRDGRVVVRVRGDAELGGVRAVVQVQAVCARGS
jgi:hypothetical protein